MDYGKILSRAWTIVWENKWLLVLGFLAALGSGGSSGGSSNFRSQSPGNFGSDFPNDFRAMWSEFAPFIGIAIGFFILLVIILWLVSLVGEAGMIASVNRLEAGEKVTLRDGFQAGISYLKNMIPLSLVLFGPFLIVGLIFAVIGISFAIASLSDGGDFPVRSFGMIGLCLAPLACILGIAGVVVSFVYPMAQRGIIIEGLGLMAGIRRGWQVLRTNIVEIILLGIIFAIIGFFISIAALIVAAPLALLFILPTAVAAFEGSAVFTTGTIMMVAIGVMVFIVLAAAVGSILRAFQSTAFTLGYHHWTGKASLTPPFP